MPASATSAIMQLDGSGRNTKVTYMYCDGANYKTGASVVLAGRVDPTEAAAIEANLSDGQYFIPGQVGLTDLQDSFVGCASEWNPEYDHPYHRLLAVSSSEEAPTADLPIEDFAKRVRETHWDDDYRPACYEAMAERYNERIAQGMEL